MVDIQSATAEIKQGKNQERKKKEEETGQTRMWPTHRDGRPAKYRWRPLFKATKFG